MNDIWASRIRRILAARWPWLVLLLLMALCYYGSYYRHGVNFRDEGGTIALGAQRIMQGEVPIREVSLNYNVMWFYPVVWLFDVTGVSYVALRAYCFFLSTIAALLGFVAVEKARAASGIKGVPWCAFLVGVMLVLVPGMTFKNYMPLLAIANTLAVLTGALVAMRRLALPVFAGGILLGATFLIRIDVGIFFALLWVLMLISRLVEKAEPLKFRLLALGVSVVGILGLGFAAHLPVLHHASSRGYRAEFIAQYANWVSRITLGKIKFDIPQGKKSSTPSKQNPPEAAVAGNKNTLQHPSLAGALRSKSPWFSSAFVVLCYLPFITLCTLLALAAWRWIASLPAGETRRPLAALVLIGGALTVFPQFWFFRPDAPHLSEFMPGFWVGTVGAWFLLRDGSGRMGRRLWWLGIFMCLHAGIYAARMLQDRWTGTIDARWSNKTLFEGENGVRVFVQNKEIKDLNRLRDLIRQQAGPEDYVVAYPYLPAVNLLADRRTYECDVYVDNLTAGHDWSARAIERFERYEPAVIIFSDWAVNGYDESRFSRWAAPAVAWIQAHYEYAGELHFREKFQIYIKKISSLRGRQFPPADSE